jgi:hypothetical protein
MVRDSLSTLVRRAFARQLHLRRDSNAQFRLRVGVGTVLIDE